MEVVVVKIVGKESSTVVAGVIVACISPFAGDGLDEALGLAIGLWARIHRVSATRDVWELEEERGLGSGGTLAGGWQ